jgi:hypothetical protein
MPPYRLSPMAVDDDANGCAITLSNFGAQPSPLTSHLNLRLSEFVDRGELI